MKPDENNEEDDDPDDDDSDDSNGDDIYEKTVDQLKQLHYGYRERALILPQDDCFYKFN